MSRIADPKIGVALGGGAARGLTHIAFIQAMDELGLKPNLIAGSSIGALLGAGWAAGLSGQEIREFAIEYLGSLRTIMGRIWRKRFTDVRSLLRNGLSMQLDALEVIESFIPENLPDNFEDLDIPFKLVATDLFSWHQATFHAGPLVPAIAASVAIPTVFKPVKYAGRTMIDGSVINPLPLDLAARGNDILVAVDVSGEPSDYSADAVPSGMEIGWRSAQIMMHALASSSMAAFPPDVYARPDVKQFGSLEFWRVREIIEAGSDETERFKRQLAASIERFIVAQQKNL